MPRITKVYTRTGDDGETGLGTGARISKTAPRIEAYGTLDELNSAIGVALAGPLAPELREPLLRIQNELFHAGAELCVPESDKAGRPGPRIEQRHVVALESLMDKLSAVLPPLENFLLPGGAPGAAQLHFARTIARRAERATLHLRAHEPIGVFIVPYLNRLSDALFVMARYQNHAAGVPEPLWDSHA